MDVEWKSFLVLCMQNLIDISELSDSKQNIPVVHILFLANCYFFFFTYLKKYLPKWMLQLSKWFKKMCTYCIWLWSVNFSFEDFQQRHYLQSLLRVLDTFLNWHKENEYGWKNMNITALEKTLQPPLSVLKFDDKRN